MNDTLNRLNEQINVLLDQIQFLEGDEKTAALKEVDTLHALRIEELKVEEESAKNIADNKEAKKTRIGKFITDALTVGVPAVISVVFMNRGFKFEETGTYRSNTFRWLQKFIRIGR